ncbi:XPG domain containing-domain-containing protein [Echria macrotheca]|uniref:XPG domain containing-domain-containing protein n=1 Tax=Echria macrotheca TaxID=438768 RepID=A0AAJ0F9X3_9PEZI|nr:XPG domain containing-domain-containing protein [Echria macrotheca]
MGIPRLKARLQPYGERGVLQPCRAVIDGPALAYHILGLCLRNSKSSPFEQPSYAQLAKTALEWLDQVGRYGVFVSAIYFDGYLPQQKRPERLDRLRGSSKALANYYRANTAGVPRQRAHFEEDASVELFPDSGGKESKLPPPPPTFLVAAIFDALRNSEEYSSRTRMVPGEADGFCAEHAVSNDAVVFTGDSDLLLHDIGPNGRVVFFGDIEADLEEGQLKCVQFRVSEIRRRLELNSEDGLAQLGFEIFTDPHSTLKEAAERARRRLTASKDPISYDKFLKQFVSPETAPRSECTSALSLDTKVSELLLSCLPMPDEKQELDDENGDSEGASKPVEMFLPFLLDCPTRTSAWEPSRHVRQVGYSLLQSIRGASIPSVSEFRRLQGTSSGTRVPVLSPADMGHEISQLLNVLSTIRSQIQKPELIWALLAIYQDVVLAQEQNKGSPLSFQLLRQYALGTLDQGSWGFIHFLAETQATLFSLRLLCQIVDFTKSLDASKLPPKMTELREELADLPPLEEYPWVRNFADILRDVGRANGFACLAGIFSGQKDIVEQIEAIQGAPTPKNKKAKKRKASVSQGTTASRTPSSNPFEALAGRDA